MQQLVTGMLMAVAIFDQPIGNIVHGCRRYAVALRPASAGSEFVYLDLVMSLLPRLLNFLITKQWFREATLLEWYPPFLWMRIKVVRLSVDWRQVHIQLPLNSISRNPGGVMFGGFQAALADPIPSLACVKLFPGYRVLTRAMTIEFEKAGTTDLEMRFEFPPETEALVRAELAANGRSTPEFAYGFYLRDGTLCTRIRNTVAIRPRGPTPSSHL